MRCAIGNAAKPPVHDGLGLFAALLIPDDAPEFAVSGAGDQLSRLGGCHRHLSEPSGALSSSRPEGFDLESYARQSFGLAHDDVEDVILRFNAKAAPDARNWRFHASQVVTDLRDGRVEIRMRCSGMLELAHHLFGWGPNMEIIAPERLKRIMRGELVRALDQHAPGSVRESARKAFAPPGTTWESYGGGTGQP